MAQFGNEQINANALIDKMVKRWRLQDVLNNFYNSLRDAFKKIKR